MQTCSRCNASSPDQVTECQNCKADLGQFSTNAVTLKKFQANLRVTSIRINAAGDACPLCSESRGVFEKLAVPKLPHEGCSHERGCRCAYEPILNEIYP